MKKEIYTILITLALFALIISIGCGGGGNDGITQPSSISAPTNNIEAQEGCYIRIKVIWPQEGTSDKGIISTEEKGNTLLSSIHPDTDRIEINIYQAPTDPNTPFDPNTALTLIDEPAIIIRDPNKDTEETTIGPIPAVKAFIRAEAWSIEIVEGVPVTNELLAADQVEKQLQVGYNSVSLNLDSNTLYFSPYPYTDPNAPPPQEVTIAPGNGDLYINLFQVFPAPTPDPNDPNAPIPTPKPAIPVEGGTVELTLIEDQGGLNIPDSVEIGNYDSGIGDGWFAIKDDFGLENLGKYVIEAKYNSDGEDPITSTYTINLEAEFDLVLSISEWRPNNLPWNDDFATIFFPIHNLSGSSDIRLDASLYMISGSGARIPIEGETVSFEITADDSLPEGPYPNVTSYVGEYKDPTHNGYLNITNDGLSIDQAKTDANGYAKGMYTISWNSAPYIYIKKLPGATLWFRARWNDEKSENSITFRPRIFDNTVFPKFKIE